MTETIKTWLFGQPKNPDAIRPPVPVENQIPYEMYSWSLSKCFDACVGELSDKYLLREEKHCITECVVHLKANPIAYQQSQGFYGFNEKTTETRPV